MLNCSECCQPSQNRQSAARHRFDLVGGILPSLGLAACLPKCPVRLTAVVLFLTGLGISLTSAASFRALLIIGYVAVQFFFMYRISLHLYRALQRDPQRERS